MRCLPHVQFPGAPPPLTTCPQPSGASSFTKRCSSDPGADCLVGSPRLTQPVPRICAMTLGKSF